MEEHDNLPPAAPRPVSQKKSLAIAVAVSSVFLLAAAGICYWLLTKPAGITTAQQPAGDGSENVKNVAWIPPAALPAGYMRRDQNLQNGAATSYYFDAAAGCGITTNIQVAQTGVSAKDAVVEAAKAAQSYGIAMTNSVDSDIHNIKDEDGQHTYDFKSVQLEQSVAVAGVPYNAQRTVVAFKQFGGLVASIGYSCRSDAWEAKKAELQTYVNQFVIKTD